ncbi:MAG: M14 family metallopeptidase [Chloroflexota bacterium]
MPSHRALGLAVRASRVALGAALIGLLVPALPAAAAEPSYPSYDSRYHTNAEMVAEIHATEAAYPDLVDVMSIGKSYRGRDIWVAKVSDNVAVDEDEPEILVDALHHARERLTLEQALYLLKTLTADYATDASVRSLVDSRETWIIFSVNPDGHVYDLSGNPYRLWRKNRQPTPGSSYVGTDLNRNYDYRWGCCGGSSRNPAAWNYRGPAPFSAPETRVVRDFVNSRVVGGMQQLRVHVTLHTNGEQVLWPYGYTKTNLPGDMTRDDYRTFVAVGRAMAARNGYTPMQSSDLYVTDGDQIDWMYGRHRIFSFTWELHPPEQSSAAKDHYSPDEIIGRETARNRSALLYALRIAECPYAVVGLERANCGPFFDDLEGSKAWKVNPDGTDTAKAGRWQRGNPQATAFRGPKQLGTTVSGSRALVTGKTAGATAVSNDLDGGVTTIRSTSIALPETVGRLTFRYYLAHSAASSPADWLRVWVEGADGTRTLVLEERGAANDDDAAWALASVPMAPWAGQVVRIVIGAADGGPGNLVEAAVDDVRIRRP